MPRFPPASAMPGYRIRRSNRSICGACRKFCTRERYKKSLLQKFYTTIIIYVVKWNICPLAPEENRMPPAKRRVMAVQSHEVPPVQATPAPQRRVGRPPGEASTIVNIRLPLSLVAQLDDYLDRLEGQTGLKAHQGGKAGG